LEVGHSGNASRATTDLTAGEAISAADDVEPVALFIERGGFTQLLAQLEPLDFSGGGIR